MIVRRGSGFGFTPPFCSPWRTVECVKAKFFTRQGEFLDAPWRIHEHAKASD